MTNILGKYNTIFRGQTALRPPFFSDLNTWHKGIDGITFAESINNLPAKLIPGCGKLDTNNYLIKDISNFESSAASGFVEGYTYYDGTSTVQYVWGSTKGTASNVYFWLRIVSGKPQIVVRNGAEFSNTYQADNVISTGWHKIKGLSTGSVYEIHIDDVLVDGTPTFGVNDGKWITDVDDRNNISIGTSINASSPLPSNLHYTSWVNFNDQYKWYVTGEGQYCYDVIGGEHMGWVGSDHIFYDDNGSTHLLFNGYTKFYKAGEVFEYVPYKIDNTKYDASAFLSDYTELYTTLGADDNLAPSVLDFDPDDTLNSKLDIFDKSNATMHIATGSMLYYNASNVYAWRQDERSDPRIYTTYFNNGYEGKYYSKIKTVLISEEYFIKGESEILNYITDKKGDLQFNVIKYCKTDVYVVYVDGQPTTDINGYIVMDI